ncbi:MAG: tautomerase family protein [Candidatus Eiseniibacteriota bacterium]
MPILEVELVGEVASETRRGLAERIAQSVAAVLNAETGSVWVRLRFTPASDYGENGPPAGHPDPTHPVFVTINRRALPPASILKQEARLLAAVVAGACHRVKADVHIIYEPPGKGRVAFGGSLID